MFKKVLSLVLASVIVLSLGSTASAAKKDIDINETEVADYLNEVKKNFDNEFASEMLDNAREQDVEFSLYIENVKENNPNASTEELIKLIDWDINFSNSNQSSSVGESFLSLLDEFDDLTDSEKTLSVLYPKEALIVKSCAEQTDEFVLDEYGSMDDGDEANAYRHALWNGFMTQAFASETNAIIWSDAHEDYTYQELLEAGSWNGFTAFEHKDMDLHNNAEGAGAVKWYEFYISATTISNRILDKIEDGDMIILVD